MSDAAVRSWRRCSPEDDGMMEQMRAEGASLREIGKALGRHTSTVYSRLMRLAEQAESD